MLNKQFRWEIGSREFDFETDSTTSPTFPFDVANAGLDWDAGDTVAIRLIRIFKAPIFISYDVQTTDTNASWKKTLSLGTSSAVGTSIRITRTGTHRQMGAHGERSRGSDGDLQPRREGWEQVRDRPGKRQRENESRGRVRLREAAKLSDTGTMDLLRSASK